MDHRELADRIKPYLKEKRFRHTLGVAETAVKLAEAFGEDAEKARAAGLLHDIARGESDDRLLELCRLYRIEPDPVEMAVPNLLHGKIGAEIAREQFGVTDDDILEAIRSHTTGRQGMTTLGKIIFIADMVEPGRSCPGVDTLRELAFKDLDRSVLAGLASTLRYVLDRGFLIHPASIEARNSILINLDPGEGTLTREANI